jgi:hypothetical protein
MELGQPGLRQPIEAACQEKTLQALARLRAIDSFIFVTLWFFFLLLTLLERS